MVVDSIMAYLIAFGAIFAISAACAMFSSYRGIGFSVNVFLISASIAISLLVWATLLPIYMIVVSLLIIAGVMFSPQESGVSE